MDNKKMDLLILKFLLRFYPITRIKVTTKLQKKAVFRRGILFDDGTIYELSDSVSMNTLYYRLIDVIKKVFGCDEQYCKHVLNMFF